MRFVNLSLSVNSTREIDAVMCVIRKFLNYRRTLGDA